MTQWQPIRTAPRPECEATLSRPFLVKTSGGHIFAARSVYESAYECEGSYWVFVPAIEGGLCPSCWLEGTCYFWDPKEYEGDDDDELPDPPVAWAELPMEATDDTENNS